MKKLLLSILLTLTATVGVASEKMVMADGAFTIHNRGAYNIEWEAYDRDITLHRNQPHGTVEAGKIFTKRDVYRVRIKVSNNVPWSPYQWNDIWLEEGQHVILDAYGTVFNAQFYWGER